MAGSAGPASAPQRQRRMKDCKLDAIFVRSFPLGKPEALAEGAAIIRQELGTDVGLTASGRHARLRLPGDVIESIGVCI